jgi:starch phosphorylase
MRESMARLTPKFSTNRVVRQYTDNYYLEAASGYLARAADHGRLGRDLLEWQAALGKHWSALRFGAATSVQQGDQHVFQVQVYLDELDPDAVKVELYADGVNGGEPIQLAMVRGERLVGSANGFIYTARVPANRPVRDYTPRISAHHIGAFVPLEASHILWHESPSWR